MCPVCMTTILCVAAGTASGAGLMFGGMILRIKRLHGRNSRAGTARVPLTRGLS